MAQIIKEYKDKKIVEYLEKGQRNLIVFYHGLGDLVMFYPLFEYVQKLYPEITFDLGTERGCDFHETFGAVACDANNFEMMEYDYVFVIKYAMSENSGLTKTEYCAINEFGLNITELPTLDLYKFKQEKSPLVAVHLQGTCLPGSTNPSEEVAKQIWQDIKDCGFIPIETHFVHCYNNPVNEKFWFVDAHVRNVRAELWKLIGLLQRCHAFVGVASGPFVLAMSIMPDRMLYLEKMHKLESYTGLDLPRANVMNYNHEVKRWLSNANFS